VAWLCWAALSQIYSENLGQKAEKNDLKILQLCRKKGAHFKVVDLEGMIVKRLVPFKKKKKKGKYFAVE
jgi:hypothetical protein